MTPQAKALFAGTFGFDPDEIKSPVAWLPPFADYVAYDETTRQFLFPIGRLEERERESFAYHLSRFIEMITGDESLAELKPIRNVETDELYLVLEPAVAQALAASPKTKEGPFHTAKSVFTSYYADATWADLKRWALEAYNIDLDALHLLTQNGPFAKVGLNPVDKEEGKDYVLTFSAIPGQPTYPVMGRQVLIEALEKTLINAVNVLSDETLAGPNAAALQEALLGGDVPPPLTRLVWDATDPRAYILALDMQRAKIMAEAGLCVDFGTIVEHHATIIAPGASDALDGESRDAAHVAKDRFMLSNAELNGRSLRIREGDLDLLTVSLHKQGSTSYDYETGQIAVGFLQQKGEETILIPYDQIEFGGSLSFDLLHPKDLPALTEGLNAYVRAQAPALSLAFQLPGRDDSSYITFPYAALDEMLQQGERLDLTVPLAPYLSQARQKIKRAAQALRIMNGAFGFPIDPSTTGGFPRVFSRLRFNEKTFQLNFEHRCRTTREDIPELQNIFQDLAKAMEEVFKKNAVTAASVSVHSHAGILVGGVLARHSLEIEFQVTSMEHAESLAQGLFSLRRELRPLIERALPFNTLENTFGSFSTEDFDDADPLLAQQGGAAAKAIERLREGAKELSVPGRARFKAATMSLDSYLSYLTESCQDKNAAISALAKEELKTVASLSPALAKLVARRKAQAALPG